MNNIEFEAAVVSLLETTLWTLVDNSGKVDASFTPKELLLPTKVLPYKIEYNIQASKLLLSLFEEDGVKTRAILEYVKNKQAWFGRSFVGGFIQITPQSNMSRWEQVSLPTKFMQMSVSKKVEGTVYADQIYMDYKVPAFNISTIPGVHYLTKCKSAIALIACNRLEYFTKSVQALALTPESKAWPIFLFLDLPMDKSHFQDNLTHLEVMKTHFPDAIIVQRPCNFGVGKNVVDARRQLFDVLGFKYVYLIEDDVVVAPNCFTILDAAWEWANKNLYQNVGVVQSWWLNTKREPSTYVDISVNELWGYAMSKDCWDDIKAVVYEYEQKFLFSRYHERPHKTIGQWFESIPSNPIKPGYPLEGERLQVLRGFMSSVQTSQQWVVLIAMYKKGWLRVHPKINLCENIGRSGIGKKEDYDNMHYADVHNQTFPNISEFEEAI